MDRKIKTPSKLLADKKIVRIFGSLSLAISLFWTSDALSECVGLIRGPVVIDANACKVVDAPHDFSQKTSLAFFNGLNAEEKNRLLSSYRGLLVNGVVVKSRAISDGLDPTPGALLGRKIGLFIPANVNLNCNTLANQRLDVGLKEVCCSGGAESPCLLDTSFVSEKISPVGPAGSAAGDQERTKTAASPEYTKALKLFTQKKYAEVAKLLNPMFANSELDVKGHYLLGASYRELDQCDKAIAPLKIIFDRAAKKDIWADQALIVRKANFLLARCYAKTNQAERAAIILNSFLIEPKQHIAELRTSLKHPDFGWIRSTQEFERYATEARKKLRELNKTVE